MIAVPTLGLIAGRSWWPKLHAAASGAGGTNLRDVTTYTLRKGDPATTRTDVVVVTVGRRGDAFRVAPGGEAVRDAYGRGFAALLRSAGFSADEGSAASFWATDKIRAGALVAVGIGAGDPTDPAVIRRAAGVAARNLGNAGSVALALPADDADAVRAVVEGFWSGGSTVREADRVPPAHVTVLSSAARRQDAVAAFEAAPNPLRTLARRTTVTDFRTKTVAKLSEAPALLPALPVRVRLIEGCDKQLATCRERFGNAVNFRGEAHLPGNDLLTRYPGA